MITLVSTLKEINKLARKIARLTDNNDHNQSVLELAKFLEDKEAIEKMEAIQAKHQQLGYMEHAWMSERYSICKSLLNIVHVKYGTQVKDKLNGCF